jgi:hypothetical protein
MLGLHGMQHLTPSLQVNVAQKTKYRNAYNPSLVKNYQYIPIIKECSRIESCFVPFKIE